MNDYEPKFNPHTEPDQNQPSQNDISQNVSQPSTSGTYTAPTGKGVTFRSSNDAKYKNARVNLLLVVIFSAINVFSILFTNTYFLFSAFIPQLITEVGAIMYQESGVALFAVVASVLSLVTVVPYLLAWIFSKKNVGWMIAATVLYTVDTLLFLGTFISLIMQGEIFGIADIVFHAWVIFSLISAVVYGLRASNEKEVSPAEGSNAFAFGNAAGTPEAGQQDGATRMLTVTREKKFAGSAIQFICFVNGQELFRLKNGETKAAEVPASAFELGFMLANEMASDKVTVRAGDTSIAYSVLMQMGFNAGKFVITEKTL